MFVQQFELVDLWLISPSYSDIFPFIFCHMGIIYIVSGKYINKGYSIVLKWADLKIVKIITIIKTANIDVMWLIEIHSI